MGDLKSKLGKIESVTFGRGGYQDAMFGLAVTLTMKGSGVNDFVGGAWDPATMPRSERAQWTEEDRSNELVEMCRKVSKLLSDANVDDVTKLVGKPVEVTFEGSLLKSWRILTEVI